MVFVTVTVPAGASGPPTVMPVVPVAVSSNTTVSPVVNVAAPPAQLAVVVFQAPSTVPRQVMVAATARPGRPALATTSPRAAMQPTYDLYTTLDATRFIKALAGSPPP